MQNLTRYLIVTFSVLASIASGYSHVVWAEEVFSDSQPQSLCPVAKTSDSHGQPVFFWQHTFADGAQDLAMAILPLSGALDVKRVSFSRNVNADCHYHALAIARGGVAATAWGWHLVWQAAGNKNIRYARMDGEAWVSSPTKTLASVGQLVGQPAIITSEQQVWVVWAEVSDATQNIYAVFSDDEGRNWREARLIKESSNVPVERVLIVKDHRLYLTGVGIAEPLALDLWK